jgi:Predicted dehydrogenases and related proteins
MKQIGFGIIGTGSITEWFLKGAREDSRFKAVGIYSRSEERGRRFADTHGIEHSYTSLNAMLESPDIHAVYIASPNYAHAAQAIRCMESRRHVLCEKPMASNSHEARMMIEVSRQNGVLLMEAMIATLNPNFARLRENMARVGTVRRYFAGYCQYSSRYDRYKQGELPNAFNPALSNGAVMDIGIYTIYPMVALFGRPESISASGILLPSGADGQGAVNFTYPGMNATVMYSKIANSYLPVEIEGEEGNLSADTIHTIRTLKFIPRPEPTSGRPVELCEEVISEPLDHDRYYYEVREFIDLIINGKTESEVNSLNNSLATLEIIDAIRQQLGIVYPTDTENGNQL